MLQVQDIHATAVDCSLDLKNGLMVMQGEDYLLIYMQTILITIVTYKLSFFLFNLENTTKFHLAVSRVFLGEHSTPTSFFDLN